MLQLRILFLLFLSPSIFAQSDYTLKILGTVQDAGSPHILCVKTCCNNLDLQSKSERKVSSIAIQNNATGAFYVFDATPDFPSQIKMMAQSKMPAGVFLTHAHKGHYTGLMFLGREGLGASKVPVFAMPKMKHFLTTNGPWSQLVALENIEIFDLQNKESVKIEEQLTVMPFLVPHRDEYSETVGYEIKI
jgi:pyrroloquinoline quinone biosynthesis protein B